MSIVIKCIAMNGDLEPSSSLLKPIDLMISTFLSVQLGEWWWEKFRQSYSNGSWMCLSGAQMIAELEMRICKLLVYRVVIEREEISLKEWGLWGQKKNGGVWDYQELIVRA